jgi:hypothetical protein
MPLPSTGLRSHQAGGPRTGPSPERERAAYRIAPGTARATGPTVT